MWFLETTSPLWFVVLLAATSVAGTVAVLLIVETARDRPRSRIAERTADAAALASGGTASGRT
jgi:hypothetical protein